MTAADDPLRVLIEAASSAIGKSFSVRGCVTPMYHAETRAGDVFLLDDLPGDKNLAVMLVRAFFELKDVVRFVFMDEAWVVERDNITPEEMAFMDEAGLSTHRDRREVVAFLAEDELHSLSAEREIIRGKGRPKLAPLRFLSVFGRSEGRMTNMLKKPTAQQ
jgi:hypothetical protein